MLKSSQPVVAGPAMSMLPTTPPHLTAQGTILGTFQYMAPEVVYEMLTGKHAFEGKTSASLIAAILEHEPATLTTLQPLVPKTLDRIVGKCLAKEPELRWQSAGDLTDELRWVTETTTKSAKGPFSTRTKAARRFPLVWAIAVLLVGILTATAAFRFLSRTAAPQPEVVRTFISIAPADQLRSIPADGAADSAERKDVSSGVGLLAFELR
jgi:hypothetical protein